MIMLSIEELSDLEDDVMKLLPEKISEILSRANRNGELEDLLQLLGMADLLSADNRFETYKNGKIVVIGGTGIKEEVFVAIGKQLGIDKKRFEFCLDYEDIQKYDFKKLQYQPQYRIVLCGPAPHSTRGKGDAGSIIAEMERSMMYPRVERLLNGNELKITKSNFRAKLQQLIDENYI
jgi:hypothetical protein